MTESQVFETILSLAKGEDNIYCFSLVIYSIIHTGCKRSFPL
jgi:hypothetical protein